MILNKTGSARFLSQFGFDKDVVISDYTSGNKVNNSEFEACYSIYLNQKVYLNINKGRFKHLGIYRHG